MRYSPLVDDWTTYPAIVIIVVLLAITPRHEMHPPEYVFGSAGLVNQTGGWNSGLAFLFGLLSVQWTVRLAQSQIEPPELTVTIR